METILTKDEFIKLFKLNDELKALGYGIEKDSDKYFVNDKWYKDFMKQMFDEYNKIK